MKCPKCNRRLIKLVSILYNEYGQECRVFRCYNKKHDKVEKIILPDMEIEEK